MPRRRAALLAITATLTLGACALPSSSATIIGAPARRAPAWHSATISAAGVRQWLECAGRGRATVVVIPGLRATHRMWHDVLPSMAGITRTCVYDRPGLSPSPGRSPHRVVSASTHAHELWALLTAAGERPPFIVVGHSYGGFVARAFVKQRPGAAAGLMLIEGVTPADDNTGYWDEGGDSIDLHASAVAADHLRLGRLPLVVESAADPNRSRWGGPSYGESAVDVARWRRNQAAATRLSTNYAWVVVAHSAHIIEQDRPGAVIAGVRLLVEAATTGRHLSPCALRAWGTHPHCPS